MKIIVAIANHGIKNQCYLDSLLSEYRSMPADIDIVVLSDIEKKLGDDVEVLVGAPTDNPWSLPFAHRNLFIQRQDQYDYFIYSEDDTLLTWVALKGFIESANSLEENEIAGFMRVEKGPANEKYLSTCHSFFRWIPSSVRERDGEYWARYSNEHAACYVINKKQLRNAISSGSFPVTPHEGRHDMLCAAATDIYTLGGIERVVCIDRLNEFTLPHLPNKYIGKMGLPEEEMEWQLNALRRIHNGELSDYELLDPETKLPGAIGSKFYHEKPDITINSILGDVSKKVLVWGAGDGILEQDIMSQGHHVDVVPMDAVVGESCAKRGLTVLSPDILSDGVKKFEAIVLCDIVHLLDDSFGFLEKIHSLLLDDGIIIIRIPNLNNARLLKKRLRDPRFSMSWTKESIGAIPYSSRILQKIVGKAGFDSLKVTVDIPNKMKKYNIMSLGIFSEMLSPNLYLTGRVSRKGKRP